ncbi:S8 family serine peptidase [Alphaproteobacteria bacterium]|nr:S8 family serine peptidase [Alphaproteobacteria bacterium]
MYFNNSNKYFYSGLILIALSVSTPKISFAQENSFGKFLTNMFSKENKVKSTQIFKADINSINLVSLEDFEYSIQDVLKNYFDKETVNKIINNISNEDDKNIQATNIEGFLKLLPKSSADKINGPAIIRLANQLGVDKKTIFEVKKNIVFQVSKVNGINLALVNVGPAKNKLVEVKKEKEQDLTKTASSTTGWIAGVAGLGLAAGGGGGGGSSSSSSLNTTVYETTEYNTQYGLGNINVSTAYARGYTGSGVTVSVLDNTFDTDHPDLVGVFTTGYNAATAGTDVTCTGTCTSSHGTHVAGIIAANKNDVGMHGVAYNATIKPIRIADGTWNYDITTAQLVNAIGAASGNTITAMNNSWGVTTTASLTIGGTQYFYQKPAVSSLSSSETSAWESAVANTVVVWANGNHGLNNSTGSVAYYSSASNALAKTNRIGYANNLTYLNVNTPSRRGNLAASNSTVAGKWLTVVALDSSNNIASYSNGCGTAKAFCISAPGSAIYSTVDLADTTESGSYATYNGTSMAAPHVTGALAILKQQFPNLTPTQLVSLLISTATDLGTSGVDEVYGVGMLNLSAATVPSGMSYIAANNANTLQATTNNTYIISSSAFGNAFNDTSLNVGIIDAYDRAYIWNPTIESVSLTNINADDYLNQFMNSNTSTTDIGTNAQITFKSIDKNIANYNNLQFSYQGDDITFSSKMLKDKKIFYLINTDKENLPSFTNIFSNFSSINQHTSEWQLSDNIKLFSMISSGKTDTSNKVKEFSVNSEYNSGPFISKLSFGNIYEKNSFLGASFSGGYELSDETKSTFFNFSSQNKLSKNIMFSANYLKMISNADFKNSNFVNFSTVKSDSMELGLSASNFFETKDEISLNYKIPLAVYKGSMDQSTVKGYTSDGDYNSVNENYSLINRNRQKTISLNYKSNFEENTNFFSTIHMSDNWNNQNDNTDYGVLAGFKMKF